MPPSRPSPRLVATGLTVLACAAAVAWMGSRLLADPTIFPPDDFVEYWAAGRLNALGQNPYDGALLLPLEREAGRNTDMAVMMWNPPWTLTPVMPIGLLRARVAQLIWLAASLTVVIWCTDRLWMIYNGPRERRWVAWALALSFLPTLFVLQAGQIGPFVLLGITGFLMADRAGRPWLAGSAAVLMAIKPHLVYLFWVCLALWAVRRPMRTRWKVIAGGLFVGVIATAIPVAANARVLDQYRDAMMNRPPELWKSPTLGSLLREWLGPERFDLQFVPTLAGLAWLLVVGWQDRRRTWDWTDRMPMVLFVSFLTSSYGAWPFDLVVLLPGVVRVAAELTTAGDRPRLVAGAIVYATINGAALVMNLAHCTSELFVWMAPSLLAAYLAFQPGARQ